MIGLRDGAIGMRAPRFRRALRTGGVLIALGVGGLTFQVRNADAQAAGANSTEQLVHDVVERLIAVADVPAHLRSAWPPKVVFKAGDDEVNAYARCAGTPGEPRYEVIFPNGIMQQVVKRDRDVLAFIAGHELAHVLLGHTDCARRRDADSELVAAAGSRAQEMASDSLGMHLAVKAGFSFRRAIRGMLAISDATGDAGSTVQRLASSHPTWTDRGTFVSMQQGDREMVSLWRSMSAFANGNYYLMIEQYEAAARAFRQVTNEFPSAYEAWANLGFALLMRYADGLDTEDLRRFDIGQLVIPGFYRRPETLEAQVRGIDSQLWWDAVGALREAIRLKPDLTLALAHLGIAHLIHPSGTRDVGNATRYLREAAALAARDPAIAPLDRIAIEINAGVAELAAGGEADAIFTQALDALRATARGGRQSTNNALAAAIDYNRALLLETAGTADARRDAVQMLERYLAATPPSSAWWQIAYERYVRLCTSAGIQPKSDQQFRQNRAASIRVIAGVEVEPGTTIGLGEPVAEVTKRLGKATRIPAVAGTNLVVLSYGAMGLDILANDQVLAIVLRGPNAPAIPLRSQGLGGTSQMLRIGMPVAEFEQIAGEYYDMKRLTSDDVYYRYYRDLGIGVRVVDSRVAEIVVAQIPNRI